MFSASGLLLTILTVATALIVPLLLRRGMVAEDAASRDLTTAEGTPSFDTPNVS